MNKKIFFDTLNYAKLLEQGEVERADVHSAALAEVFAKNIYTKDEVDKMIEDAIKKFDRTCDGLRQDMVRFEQRFEQALARDFAYHQQEMLKLENRFEKKMNRHFIKTLSVLGSLIVAGNAFSALLIRMSLPH